MNVTRQCNNYWDYFISKLDQVGYRDKGIFHSEAFLFLALCKSRAITWVVESGMKSGQSTKMILEYLDMPLTTFEKEESLDNRIVAGELTALYGDDLWTLHFGDSNDRWWLVLTEFASIYGHTACLIDGPKGDAAIELAKEVWDVTEVGLVAIHDCPQERLSEAPENARVFHSHDIDFRYRFGDPIDTKMPEAWREKYPNGPGLAIWIKD